jgi:hypothetical protein
MEKKETSYVRVAFADAHMGKTYTYIAEGTKEEIEKFTHAVVDSPFSGYTLVKIKSVEPLDFSSYTGSYKFIVCVVDDTEYKARLERDKRRVALEKDIRRRVDQKRKEIELATLIGDDEELKAMFEELKSL